MAKASIKKLVPRELRRQGWFLAKDKNDRYLLRNRRVHLRTGSSDKLETAIKAAWLISQGIKVGIPTGERTITR